MADKSPGYVTKNGIKWHLKFDGDHLVVRLVEHPEGNGRVFTHMPAGNVVIVAAEALA